MEVQSKAKVKEKAKAQSLLSACRSQKMWRGTPPAKRVLVVDDNPDHLELLADLLELQGYEVSKLQTQLKRSG